MEALLFLGSASFRSVMKIVLVNVLICYFTSAGDDFVKASVLANAHALLSLVFEIFTAHIAAKPSIGRIKTLMLSNIFYVMAIWLLWKFYPNDEIWLRVVELVLLALGTSGDKILKDALQDLVNANDNISRVAYVCGCVFAILLSVDPDAIGGLEFTKRQDESPKNMDMEKGENEGIKPENALHSNINGKKENRNVPNYKVVLKILFKIVPIFIVFFVVHMISATGSTFFLQQYRNLNTSVGIAVGMYPFVRTFSKFAIPFLYGWISCLPKKEEDKFGVGMICGVLACICASLMEVVSHLVITEEDTNTSISFLWLVPQFCLLGCMEGLTREGQQKFYKSIIKEEQLPSYQEKYIEYLMGIIGKFLNICLILILKRCFGDKIINDSQLDMYYLFLASLGLVNLISYLIVVRCFYKDQELADDDQKQDHLREQISGITQNQDLANEDQKADSSDDLANVEIQQDHGIEQSSDIEQSQELANEDQKEDNEDFTNVDVQ